MPDTNGTSDSKKRSAAKTPPAQHVVKYIMYLMAGLLLVGGVLDGFSNAFQIFSLRGAIVVTAIAVPVWIAISIFVRIRGVPWRVDGQLVKIKSLGPKIQVAVLGMLALIWIAGFFGGRGADSPQKTEASVDSAAAATRQAEQAAQAIQLAGQPGREADSLVSAVSAVGEALAMHRPITGALKGGLGMAVGTPAHPIAIMHTIETSPLRSVSLSHDGKRFLTVGARGDLHIWDLLFWKQGGYVEDELKFSGAVFSPDGALAVAFGGNEAQVWNFSMGGKLHVLSAHTDIVTGVSFSFDGARVLTASKDGTARIWDAESPSPMHVLLGHNGAVNSAVFSSDGSLVVSAGQDRTVKVWSATSAHPACSIDTGRVVSSVTFAPDSKKIGIGYQDGGAEVWTVDCATRLRVVGGQASPVGSIAFSGDGGHLFLASPDGTARLVTAVAAAAGLADVVRTFGIQDWQRQKSLPNYEIAKPVLSPDGRRIVTPAWDNSAVVWDVTTGKQIATLAGHTGLVTAVAVSADSSMIVTVSEDKTARVWKISSDALPTTLPGKDMVSGAAFSSDGSRVVTASDTAVNVWSWEPPFQTLERTFRQRLPIVDMVISRDGNYVVTVGPESRILDIRTGANSQFSISDPGSVTSVSISQDGRYIMSIAYGGQPQLWNSDGRLVRGVQGPAVPMVGAFSPNGEDVALAGFFGDLVLSKTATGQAILGGRLDGVHAPAVSSVMFSPDGKNIVLSCVDNTVRILDASSLREIGRLVGHRAPVQSAAYSLDGLYIVTAGHDHTVRVWDSKARREFFSIRGVGGSVYSVAFSPDDKHIITTDSDGKVRVYAIDVEGLLRLACGLLKSRDEFEQIRRFCPK